MRLRRHQSLIIFVYAKRLVEKFGDGAGPGNWWKTLGQENRERACRIEKKKLLAPLPHSFFDQPHRQPKFRERGGAQIANAGRTENGKVSASVIGKARLPTDSRHFGWNIKHLQG